MYGRKQRNWILWCSTYISRGLVTISTINNIEKKVDQLLQERNSIELKTENVIGGKAPEKFYEIAGKRVYLEIDGQPVEKYFRK